MSSGNTVNLYNADDPASLVAQEQLQRAQGLATALQQRAASPIQYDPKGPISPWQGVSQVAAGLSAALLQRNVDKRTLQMGQNLKAARDAQVHQNGMGTPLPSDAPNGGGSITPPLATGAASAPPIVSTDPTTGGTPPVVPPPSIMSDDPATGGIAGDNPQASPTRGQQLGAAVLGNSPPAGPSAPAVLASPPIAPGGQPGFVDQMTAAIAQPAPSAAPPAAPIPPAMSAAPAPAPAPQSVGNWVTGSEQGDRSYAYTDPGGYQKAVAAQHAMTDAQKVAADAYGYGTAAYKSAMQAEATKAGFIDPTITREGGSSQDNNRPGAPIIYSPHVPAGYQPIRDQTGRVVAIVPIAGGGDAVAGNAAATAGGHGAGAAPYDVVQLTGPDGSTYAVPKSSIPGFGGSPALSGPVGTPPASGGLNGHYGRTPPAVAASGGPVGAMTGLPAGAVTAANTSAANSANQLDATIAAGSNAKQAMFKLQHIADTLKGVNTGPGAEAAAETKGFINTLGQPFLDAVGLNGRTVLPNNDLAPIQEARKSVSDLALSLASVTGGARGATDARLQTALSSLADPGKAPAAIQNLTPILKSYQTAALAKSQAASLWKQQNGSQDNAGFERQWQQADNPELFYQRELGPHSFATWASKLPPQQRAAMLGQYQRLKAMGAFGASQ